MLLLRLAKAFDSAELPYAIVGGYAVALHGAVRGTVDVDLLINFSEGDFVKAEEVFAKLGLRPRLPVSAREVFRFREEYLAKRNLIAWSFVDPNRASEVVDVILTQDLAKTRVVKKRIQGTSVCIVSIDDLIQMKEASARPQDLADVEALRKLRA